MNVAPSAQFEWVFNWGGTPAAPLGVKILDNVGGTTLARTTVGISAIDTDIYAITLTAPGTDGQYSLVADDTQDFVTEDLLVTSVDTSGTVIGGTSNLYVTREELKEILGLQNETFADAAIDIAVSSASRCCDGYKSMRFYPTTETRYYSPDVFDSEFGIDDLVTVTSVTVDRAGDGTYTETWTNGTDFYLDPPNAALAGQPYRRLVLRAQANRRFTRYARSVKVTGQFGWAATPVQVKEAAILIANRFLTRMGSAPLGIQVAAAGDAVAMARLGRIDPDAAFLLDTIPGAQRPQFRSLQLG